MTCVSRQQVIVLEHERLTNLWPVQEKQELEEQRRALSEEVIRYRAKIKQLENDLLFRLSNSQVLAQDALPTSSAGTMAKSSSLHCLQQDCEPSSPGMDIG